tara:strand:+ start:47 stop:391 length:345 start_codon:yes stop_codon:yes gene_type:complete
MTRYTMIRYRGMGEENAPSDWVDKVSYLYIAELENLPDQVGCEQLQQLYTTWPVDGEPSPVARFEVVHNVDSDQAALMLWGKAFLKGWTNHDTVWFVTHSYRLPHFLAPEGGEE